MKNCARVLLAATFTLLLSCSSALGCVSLRSDVVSDRCIESDCQFQCAVHTEVDLSERLVPGFFTEQIHGHMLVTAILPNSPAKDSGLRIGDELIGVDTSGLPLLCPSNPWKIATDHRLALLRNGNRIELIIHPVPMKQLWASLTNDRFTNVSLSSNRLSTDHALAPYMSGLRLSNIAGRVTVIAVIPYTPAASAGVSVGDVVISPNVQSISDLQVSDSRTVVQLAVKSANRSRQLTIKFASMTEILEGFASQASKAPYSTVPTTRTGL